MVKNNIKKHFLVEPVRLVNYTVDDLYRQLSLSESQNLYDISWNMDYGLKEYDGMTYLNYEL